MNKRNKEVEAAKLRSEDRVLKDLKREYNEAAKRIKQNIKDLAEREQSQSVIYQAKYQEQLLNQINKALDTLDTVNTVSDYLKDSYYNGFMGSLYDIQGQGIPIILPFDQNAITKMISTTGDNIKLSKKLYSNLTALKNRVRKEVSMGIAAGEMYEQVASRIDRAANIGFNNAYRIARTEGHRVSQASALDAMQGAKDTGANVVKQWDATLDGDTRKEHRELDGQIVDIDERFEVRGRKAKHPGGFGRPELDINCRCTMLQRAKWALDQDELDRLKNRAEFFDLDKSKSFEDFKEKYLKAAEQVEKIQSKGINRKAQIYNTLDKKHVDKIEELVNGADEIKKSVWLKFESRLKLNNGKYRGGAHFRPSEGVNLNVAQTFADTREGSMVTWFHEFGHNIDYLTNNGYYSKKYKNGLFGKTIRNEVDTKVKSIQKELRDKVRKEIENESITRDYISNLYFNDLISDKIRSEVDQPIRRYERLRRKGDDETLKNEFFYSQDEIDFYKKQYDEAVEKVKKEVIKRGSRKKLAYKELEKEVRALTDAQKADLSDILEGATLAKIQAGWGHGKTYWGLSDNLSCEAFAEMFSAYMANPDSLEMLRKYLPESVKVFDEMIAELAKE